MIILRQPKPSWGLPNMSPFCAKLETYLRMSKIEYQAKPGLPNRSPSGSIPYVEMDGRVLGDSTLIIHELKKRLGDPLDQGLAPEQRAQALALQSLTEERLYFASAWLRWADDEAWSYLKQVFEPWMPPVIGGRILKKIRKTAFKDITERGGLGCYTREQIEARAKEALSAISALLGDKPYFLGSEPASIDATMYGFLIQVLWVPWQSGIKTHALGLKNLVPYCDRMKARYWS